MPEAPFCIFVPVVFDSCFNSASVIGTVPCTGTVTACTALSPTCSFYGAVLVTSTAAFDTYTLTYRVTLPVTYTCTVGAVSTTSSTTLLGSTQATLNVPLGIAPVDAAYCLPYSPTCNAPSSGNLSGTVCVELKTLAMSQLLVTADFCTPVTACGPLATCPVPSYSPVVL